MLGITAREAKAFVDNGQLSYEHLKPLITLALWPFSENK